MVKVDLRLSLCGTMNIFNPKLFIFKVIPFPITNSPERSGNAHFYGVSLSDPTSIIQFVLPGLILRARRRAWYTARRLVGAFEDQWLVDNKGR